MSLVVFEDISLGFGKKQIVEGLSLRVAEQDRVGLIGPNGSGKSSLMRVISGEQGIDQGQVRLRKGLRLGYLPQDIHLEGGRSLMDFVRSSVPGREAMSDELERVQAELLRKSESAPVSGGSAISTDAKQPAEAEGDGDELMDLAQQVADLHESLQHFEQHYSEHEAARILAGLGFSEADRGRDMGEFSGGWKMRAVLAGLLFQKPDLLLLDEPTNHLDMPSVAWFSSFLKRYKKSFILICHDREFLNEQISRVVSFEVEGVRQYRGDYEHYRSQRDEELEILQNKARNLAREREKTEQFITRFRAQANKAKAVQSRVKSLEKMESIDLAKSRSVMRLSFPPCERAGADVIKIEGLCKSYGDHRVLSGIDLVARRGQRIGIIGVNGAGKTTLLRMIADEIETSAGSIRFGSNVKVGYYAQHHADTLAGEQTIFDCVSEVNPLETPTRVRTILGAFLFEGDDVDKKIRVLSGGERARVALARLILSPGNLMLLDEPTNHLDLESSESLARSLCDYDGTLLFVSHNRSFVRTLATQIWNVENGTVEVYPGTLDEYMHACALRAIEPEVTVDDPSASRLRKSESQRSFESAGAPADSSRQGDSSDKQRHGKDRRRLEAQRRKERAKVIGPIEKKIAAIEAEIASLEDAQRDRSLELAKEETYNDAELRDRLLAEVSAGQARLDELSSQWEDASMELETRLADFEDAEG